MKTAAVNAALLVLLAALTAGALEAWLRLTIAPSSGGSIFEYTAETPRYKRMRPSASVMTWGVELRTNDLGFRDAAPTVPPKAPGELRLVVLGDSFTVSAGVPHEAIYTTRLQQALRRERPGLRVVNLAVGGYNVLQYEMVLAEVGLGLDPDHLVVALFPSNDFTLEAYEDNARVAAGERAPPAERRPTLRERSYAYRAWGERIEARLARLARGAPPPAGPGPHERGWAENWRALESIARIAGERSLPLDVVLLPGTWAFERQRESHARVLARCAALGLECLDLLEPFAASGVSPASLRLNRLDAHPNARYNALVAELLAEHFAARLSPRLPVRPGPGLGRPDQPGASMADGLVP